MNRQYPGAGLACKIAQPHADLDRLIPDVRIDPRIVDPDGVGCPQFEAADEAVPVALGVVGDAVGVVADVHDHAVVDADRQPVGAGGHVTAQLIHVRRAEAVLRAEGPPVDPDGGLPMRPLQEEGEASALPGGRDFDLPLVVFS